MKLTKREKILLYILLCFVILIGGLYVLVLPALNAKTDLEQSYQQALAKKNELQSTIDQYGNLDEALKEIQEKIIAVKENFQPLQPNEDIDALLTSKMLAYGLQPLSLTMNEIQELPLAAYGEEVIEGVDLIKSTQVTISFAGSSTAMGQLMDDINQIPGYLIQNLTFDNKSTNEPISISFNLYFME